MKFIVLLTSLLLALYSLGSENFSSSEELKLQIPFIGMKGQKGECEVLIFDPSDNIVGKAVKAVKIESDYYYMPIKIKIERKIKDYDLLRASVKFGAFENVYSIHQLKDRMIVKILGQKKFIKETPIKYRIIVKNQKTEEPISKAKVKVFLVNGSSEKKIFEGTTNKAGNCTTNFLLPSDIENAVLKFIIDSELGKEEYQTYINLYDETVTYLVTDKPIYQPGQTIYIRTLSLKKPNLKAVKGKEILYEIEDAKGNKVFRKNIKTDKFGVASCSFLLAEEANFGNWTIKATCGKEKTMKNVKVERYVLPKFKINLKTQKEFYLPGETMEGDLNIEYFFGKPVSDAKVKIELYKFDIGFNKFAQIEKTTDEKGICHFEYKLPEYFVGQPLEKGNAFVKIDIEATDKANHTEKISQSKKIVKDLINIFIIPEGGSLKPNLENRIYILANYPDGKPCFGQVEMVVDNQTQSCKTDPFGIAEFSFIPKNNQTKIIIKVKDFKGEEVEKTQEFYLDKRQDQLIMRLEKGIYKVGDEMNIEFLSTKKKGQIYLDVIKDNQTILTKSIPIVNGKGSLQINLTPNEAGSIWLNSYIVSSSQDIIRDTRFCYVHNANDLVIKARADKGEYEPGEEANILFKVTDKKGEPKVASLCVALLMKLCFL